MPDSRELSYSECEALLRAGVAGRVALMSPTGPQIVPLNYSVVDSTIIVRTSPESVLGKYGPDAVLAFEVDGFDHAYQQGWSVVARGRAGVVRDVTALKRIAAVWEPRPWASGVRSLFLRIAWTELTGRQLGTGWDPMRSLRS
jgi:nitroimidazol reductase NimA-like FMN-containing flavoprotein (pyridoxamine 5'-phosphate oxidase superfamily)